MSLGPTHLHYQQAALQRGEGPAAPVAGWPPGPRRGLLALAASTLLLAGAGFATGGESSEDRTTQLLVSSANHVDAWRVQHGYARTPDLGDVFGDDLPCDAWGNPLQLRVPGPGERDYDLGSLGRDGKRGGQGPDADLWLSSLEVNDAS